MKDLSFFNPEIPSSFTQLLFHKKLITFLDQHRFHISSSQFPFIITILFHFYFHQNINFDYFQKFFQILGLKFLFLLQLFYQNKIWIFRHLILSIHYLEALKWNNFIWHWACCLTLLLSYSNSNMSASCNSVLPSYIKLKLVFKANFSKFVINRATIL